MIRMYSEKGGYMNCKTAKEAIRLSEKGWEPAEKDPEPDVVPEPVKKTRKKRVSK